MLCLGASVRNTGSWAGHQFEGEGMSFRRNERIVVLSGPKAGKTGKTVRKDGRQWMVKLDDRMSPDYFYPTEIKKV